MGVGHPPRTTHCPGLNVLQDTSPNHVRVAAGVTDPTWLREKSVMPEIDIVVDTHRLVSSENLGYCIVNPIASGISETGPKYTRSSSEPHHISMCKEFAAIYKIREPFMFWSYPG